MNKDKNLKEKFLKIYANLPLGLRSEIICVAEDQPISWNVAFVEIDQNTPKSKTILETLDKLNLI